MEKHSIILENFFNNFKSLEPEFKKIELHSREWHEQRQGHELYWPGKRSEKLSVVSPFLHELIRLNLLYHLGYLPYFQTNWTFEGYLHLKTENDNKGESIHRDPSAYSGMIYLTDSTLGETCLFDERDNPTVRVYPVKNRLFLFPGDVDHGAINNYGDNIDNGRLNLILFFY